MKFSGADPIYIQIANYFKKLIETGVLSKDDPIPSVRDFGGANGVNPNTVARAYDLLIDEEIIVSIPKKGYFVKGGSENKEHKDIGALEKKLKFLLDDGYSKEDILDVLEKLN